MAKAKKVRFPRYINRPKLFFILEYDDAAVMVFFGVTADVIATFAGIASLYSFWLGLFFAAFFTKLYRVFKNERNKGYLHHFLYLYDLPNPFGTDMKFLSKDLARFKNKNFIPYGFETEFKE